MSESSGSGGGRITAPSAKRLNEMNRLSDMGRFPVMVHIGATLNVLLIMLVTWWIESHYYYPVYTLPLWIFLVIALNLLPVVLLRLLTLTPETTYRPIHQMSFFRDQHKFPGWVYVAASANMTFWILLTWAASAYNHGHGVLIALLILAFVCTFAPVWLRLFKGSSE